MLVRERPIQDVEVGWKEFELYCEGHNIGTHPDLWMPWWEIWKLAYALGGRMEADSSRRSKQSSR